MTQGVPRTTTAIRQTLLLETQQKFGLVVSLDETDAKDALLAKLASGRIALRPLPQHVISGLMVG